MRFKLLLIPAVLAATLIALVVGLRVYDGGRPEQIAKGITVGGVDIGGLSPAGARARLHRELVADYQRPIVVHHGRASWEIGAREARVRTDVDRLVTEALRRSDAGGLVKRSLRRLTHAQVRAQLEPTVTFSDRAVVRLVDRVRKDVSRPAQDAQLHVTPAGVDVVPGRRGLTVAASGLHKSIAAALSKPGGKRRFTARTRGVKPKVTAADLARDTPVVLIANRGANTLKLYKDFKLEKTYGIAAGQAAYPTPAGRFSIVNKAVDPTWSVPNSTWAGSLAGKVIPGGAPNNPLKARWMGITSGVGIHGTADDGSIGSNASHGCLRMHVSDVIDLYPRVPVGAPILIT